MAKKARPRRLVTRYAATRLYDGQAKSYITVADLKALRAEGYAVVVRDAETGQYVTEQLLKPGLDA